MIIQNKWSSQIGDGEHEITGRPFYYYGAGLALQVDRTWVLYLCGLVGESIVSHLSKRFFFLLLYEYDYDNSQNVFSPLSFASRFQEPTALLQLLLLGNLRD